MCVPVGGGGEGKNHQADSPVSILGSLMQGFGHNP